MGVKKSVKTRPIRYVKIIFGLFVGMIAISLLTESITENRQQVTGSSQQVVPPITPTFETRKPTTAYEIQSWNIQFGTVPAIAYGVATDSDGNAYVVGYNMTATYSAATAFLIKFAPNNTMLWSQYWNYSMDDRANGVAVDTSGNIYVAAMSYISYNWRAVLQKYSTTGTLLWSELCGPSFGGDTRAMGVAIDPSGNPFIGGFFWDGSTYFTLVAKYDPSGNQLWNRTVGGITGATFGYGITVDNAGNAIIVGETYVNMAIYSHVFIAKYNPSGTLLWNETWVGAIQNYAKGVVADAIGNLFITGTTNSSAGGDYDAFLAKFAPDSTLEWNITWGTLNQEYGRSITNDSDGNLYVAGFSMANFAFLIKYNATGTPLWNQTWAPARYVAYGAAAFTNNVVYVAGAINPVMSNSFLTKFTHVAPTLVVGNPANNSLFGIQVPPKFTVSVNEPELNAAWYSVGAYPQNFSFTPGIPVTVNEDAWWSLPNGTVLLQFWANNSLGEVGYTNITLRIDTSVPSITINSPQPNDLFGTTPPSYSIVITGDVPKSIWYSLDSGATNTTCGTSGTLAVQWSGPGNGTVTVTFWASDMAGNNATPTSVTIKKDIDAPTILVTDPTSLQIFNATAPSFALSITEGNLDHVWYSLDGGMTNTTCGTSGTLAAQWAGRGNGTVTVTFWANDMVGNTGTASVPVQKDIDAPVVIVTNPSSGQVFNATAPSFALSITEANLDQVWYSLDGGMTNTTCGTSGTLAPQWSGKGTGTVSITFWANDTAGNVNKTEINVAKDITPPSLQILRPSTGESFTDPPQLEWNVADANLENVWYTLNDDPTQFVVSGTSTMINLAAWNKLPAGEVKIHLHAIDKVGNEKTVDVNVIKQGSAPTLNDWVFWVIFIAIGGIAVVILYKKIIQPRRR